MHNNREIVPSYVINTPSKNICSSSSIETYKLFMQYFDEASSNYTKRTKQKIQTSIDKFVWEAVIVLDQHHTYKDVENVAYKLADKYGWRVLQVAWHADEGNKCEITGKTTYNWHGHIIFMMIDDQGIYRYKKRNFGKAKMSQIQTFVANELGMKRGKKKYLTKKEYLNHRQYRQVKEEIENLKIDLFCLKNEAIDLEEIMLQEYQLRQKGEKEIAKLTKKIEELQEAYAEADFESECYAAQYLDAMKDAGNKGDRITLLESKIAMLEKENMELKKNNFSDFISSSYTP
jgi:hypothetical protein